MKAMKPMARISASMREICMSRHISERANAENTPQGTSFFTVDFEMTIGDTMAATPTMSSTLKMLLPTTLPTARSEVPFSADTRLTQNSGIEVPMATMVSPMTMEGMFRRSAMLTAPSVMKSAPLSTKITPSMMRITLSIIALSFCFCSE